MRWYTIKFTRTIYSNYSSKIPYVYSSLDANGLPNPGALEVEFDIVNAMGHYIGPAAHLRIRNVPLQICQQARAYQWTKVEIFGGFFNNGLSGFKLANQEQSGSLGFGYVQACIPNYMGTEMVMDFIIVPTVVGNPDIGLPSTDAPNSPKDYLFNWKIGQSFIDAVKQTFAKPLNLKLIGEVDPRIKNNTDKPIIAQKSTFADFSIYLKKLTSNIVNPPIAGKVQEYNGVNMIFKSFDTVLIFDDTTASSTVQLKVEDFIGQPSIYSPQNLDVQSIHPLRSDLLMPLSVKFPNISTLISSSVGSVAGAQEKPLTASTAELRIKQVRHIGKFRDSSAQGWATYLTSIGVIRA